MIQAYEAGASVEGYVPSSRDARIVRGLEPYSSMRPRTVISPGPDVASRCNLVTRPMIRRKEGCSRKNASRVHETPRRRWRASRKWFAIPGDATPPVRKAGSVASEQSVVCAWARQRHPCPPWERSTSTGRMTYSVRRNGRRGVEQVAPSPRAPAGQGTGSCRRVGTGCCRVGHGSSMAAGIDVTRHGLPWRSTLIPRRGKGRFHSAKGGGTLGQWVRAATNLALSTTSERSRPRLTSTCQNPPT